MKNELAENIFIFSDQIGAGKTTILKTWTQNKPTVTGFLSVKIDGKRFFDNLKTGEKRPMEIENSDLKIGKFSFDPEIFLWAEKELLKQYQSDKEWLIIDEIGPLEIRKNQGFHALILKIIQENPASKPKIIFVVRDFMVAEFIDKYKFSHAKILSKNYFTPNKRETDLVGIALCGGESRRMKTDKALLNYGNSPQWKKVHQLLQPFCKKVVISINEKQWEDWAKENPYEFIIDEKKYFDHGPLTGVLSVLEKFPDSSLLIIGTDFPFLKLENLIHLNNERNSFYEAVCFETEGLLQPLISIIEKEAIAKLLEYYKQGNDSLRKFLGEIKTKEIEITENQFLENINTERDFQILKNKND